MLEPHPCLTHPLAFPTHSPDSLFLFDPPYVWETLPWKQTPVKNEEQQTVDRISPSLKYSIRAYTI